MRLLVGYAGAYGAANALGTLIQAARNLEGDRVGFVLVGQGPEKESLQTLASGLRNVLFLPPLAHSCIPQFLAEMDVLYIGLRNRPLFRFGVSPNKLFDYMAAGRPVVFAGRPMNDIVAEAGAGLSVAPGDPAASWAGPHASRQELAQVRERLGLNLPLPEHMTACLEALRIGEPLTR